MATAKDSPSPSSTKKPRNPDKAAQTAALKAKIETGYNGTLTAINFTQKMISFGNDASKRTAENILNSFAAALSSTIPDSDISNAFMQLLAQVDKPTKTEAPY